MAFGAAITYAKQCAATMPRAANPPSHSGARPTHQRPFIHLNVPRSKQSGKFGCGLRYMKVGGRDARRDPVFAAPRLRNRTS